MEAEINVGTVTEYPSIKIDLRTMRMIVIVNGKRESRPLTENIYNAIEQDLEIIDAVEKSTGGTVKQVAYNKRRDDAKAKASPEAGAEAATEIV